MVVCTDDGILRRIAPDGMVLDPSVATGLQGAVSMAIAPPGIFHGNLFVACGEPVSRVVEVDLSTGATSIFLSSLAVHGIAFDPEGYMHLSIPAEDRIVKIGPGLGGDMDGNGATDMDDMEGFIQALLDTPAAPLPREAVDMDGNGCANGLDVQLFVDEVMP